MNHRQTRSVFTALLLVLAVLFALPTKSFGQTFRGGINGTVTDQSGAVVPAQASSTFRTFPLEPMGFQSQPLASKAKRSPGSK